MNSVHGVLSTGRILLTGLFCTLLLQGCIFGEKRELVCGVRGEAPVGLYVSADEKKAPESGGIGAPGGCWTTVVSGAQGEAAGWLELDATTGQPTGNTAPANARCVAGQSKCRFPGSACTKVNGSAGTCKHSIFKGAGAYSVAQACTCTCN